VHALTVTNSAQQAGVTRRNIQWQEDTQTITQYPGKGKGKAKIHPKTGQESPEGE